MILWMLACAPEPLEGDVLVIGDSMFDWDEASIPDVIAQESGLQVASAAVGGAHLSTVEAGPDAIVNQYQDGDWTALVMDGGGNDLNDRCGCAPCEVEAELVDTLETFLDAIAVPVLLWGYYEVPADAEYGFDVCQGALERLSADMVAIADARDHVTFVDGRDVVTADQRQYYSEDRVHPSEAGGRVVGQQIAASLP